MKSMFLRAAQKLIVELNRENIQIVNIRETSHKCTVFQEETCGILKAAEFLQETKYRTRLYAYVRTDSQTSLKSQHSAQVNSFIAKACIERLNQVSQGNRIILCCHGFRHIKVTKERRYLINWLEKDGKMEADSKLEYSTRWAS